MVETTFGNPMVMLVVDGDTIFFSNYQGIYAVRAGGKPTRIHETDGATAYSPFWLRGDEIVIGSIDELRVLSERGHGPGESRALPAPYTRMISGPAQIVLAAEDHTFYGKHDSTDVLDPSVDFWAYDFESGASRVLASNTSVGHGQHFVRLGDYLYVTDQPADDVATSLYRVPIAGGEPELVPLAAPTRFHLVGADDQHLFAEGTPWTVGSGGPASIYRIDPATGEAQQVAALVSGISTSVEASGFVHTPQRILFWIQYKLWSIPHGSGAAHQLAASDCSVTAITTHGNELYFGIIDSEAEDSWIGKLDFESAGFRD